MRTDCVTHWKVGRKTAALTECGPRMKPCRSQPRSCDTSIFRARYHSVKLPMRQRWRRGIHEAFTTVRSRTARLLCCRMLHAAQRASRSVPKPPPGNIPGTTMADRQVCTAMPRNDVTAAAKPASHKPQQRLPAADVPAGSLACAPDLWQQHTAATAHITEHTPE